MVNTLGKINLTKVVIPVMKQQKSGLIINVVSQAGLYAKAERSVYAASKWAITGFTKAIQPELAPFGIGVTGLYSAKLSNRYKNASNIEAFVLVSNLSSILRKKLTKRIT